MLRTLHELLRALVALHIRESNFHCPMLPLQYKKTKKGKLSRGQLLLSQLVTVLENIKYSLMSRCDWTFVTVERKILPTTNVAGSIEAFNRFNATSAFLLELHSNFKKHTYFSLLSKEAAHAAILFSGMGKWNTQNGRTKSSMFGASASSCSMPLIG